MGLRSIPTGSIVQLRRASPGDVTGILACLAAAFGPYREDYPTPAYLNTVLNPVTLRTRLRRMEVFVAIAGDRNIIAGTASAEVLANAEGHLRGMAVHPEYQGRGVAQRLLETALAALRARGCVRVSLDTTAPLRRAVRLYEAHGFRATGQVTDFFGIPLIEYAYEFPAE